MLGGDVSNGGRPRRLRNAVKCAESGVAEAAHA
jgi:hypothetical protein